MYTNKTLDLIYSPYKPRINQMDIEISSEEIWPTITAEEVRIQKRAWSGRMRNLPVCEIWHCGIVED